MGKYKDLLFDTNSTLEDFFQMEELGLRWVFKKYGLHFSPDIKSLYADINDGLWTDFKTGLIDADTISETRFSLLFSELDICINPVIFESDYQQVVPISLEIKFR
ncbi:MAG: hypothetical protein RR310_06810 [Eubacterium sp.]